MNVDTSVARKMLHDYLRFKAEKFPIWGGLVRRYEDAVAKGIPIETVLRESMMEQMVIEPEPKIKETKKRGRKKA